MAAVTPEYRVVAGRAGIIATGGCLVLAGIAVMGLGYAVFDRAPNAGLCAALGLGWSWLLATVLAATADKALGRGRPRLSIVANAQVGGLAVMLLLTTWLLLHAVASGVWAVATVVLSAWVVASVAAALWRAAKMRSTGGALIASVASVPR